ncbi:MAG: hypothetical protein DRP41_07370 [Thermodesulfobacteriota bacterium]|nr:MAG: hypothetical protein DRP41_07370 [Thermodesulfobacteriota bacterium]
MKIPTLLVIGILLSLSLHQFLIVDTTDSRPYIDGNYVCRDFSRDLILSASKYHIYLDYVYVPEKNHMMVGLYNPLEGSIEIIEPQTDEIKGYVKEDNKNYIRIPVWNDCFYFSNIKIA